MKKRVVYLKLNRVSLRLPGDENMDDLLTVEHNRENIRIFRSNTSEEFIEQLKATLKAEKGKVSYLDQDINFIGIDYGPAVMIFAIVGDKELKKECYEALLRL